MKVWAVSDLHLSRDPEKSMERFGSAWKDHPQPLWENWKRMVGRDDLVLLPGDLSWSKRPQDILEDLRPLQDLPGRKILSPGNHDWSIWKTQSLARRSLEDLDSVVALKNDALRLAEYGLVVAATQGFMQPEDLMFQEEQRSLWQKRMDHLERTLDILSSQAHQGDQKILMIHYPPFSDLENPSPYTQMIEEAGVDICVFGHLHDQESHNRVLQGIQNQTNYLLVSCDALGMRPTRIA